MRASLAALPDVLATLPDARLVVGGGGVPDGLAPQLRNAVDVAGAGVLDELPQRYRDATVTVLPSVDEAFGLVLVESLACGTPVVASSSGGMPEIVTADVGKLVPPDDPVALAEAIVAVAATAAQSDTPRRCAAHAAKWSWDTIGPRHVAAYRQASSR
jgi:glycosyltransferase involved in cell wall biosynthesis